MSLQPVEFPRFGPLTLDVEAQELAGKAVDAYNVLTDDGSVRTRDGYELFNAGGTNEEVILLKSYPVAASALLLGVVSNSSTTKLGWKIYQGDGTVYSSGYATAASTDSNRAWATIVGTPSHYYLVISGGGRTPLHVLADSSLTYSTVAGKGGGPLAVTPDDNRLAASDGFSTVWFSDPDDPFTFGTNNYVQLTPGDGEAIQEMVVWRNQLFVFKETKFFVFYGTSVDSTGNPVFNYRTVAGLGVARYGSGSALAQTEGVYFVNESGLWLTTGDIPRKLSQDLDPILTLPHASEQTAEMLPYMDATVKDVVTDMYAQGFKLAEAAGYVYIMFSYGTFMYHKSTGEWSVHSIRAYGGTGWAPLYGTSVTGDAKNELYFINPYDTDNGEVYRHAPGIRDDAGVAFTGWWRGGFWNPGQPGTEAYIRELLLDGYGTVGVQTAVNDAKTLGSSASLLLGSPGAIGQNRDRRGIRCRNLSIKLSGTAPWQVTRLIANVGSQSFVGAKS